MTRVQRVRVARSALLVFAAWMAGWTLLLLAIGISGVRAEGFSPHIPGATDDTYATVVWPVDCASLR